MEVESAESASTSGKGSDITAGLQHAAPKSSNADIALPSKVSMEDFALLKVLGRGAYGKVFLVRKIGGHDSGKIYAMKVLKKARVTQKPKTLEHTLAERQVLERLKGLPYLVNMVYAFQNESKLHIVMEFVGGGELFTHLCKRKKFDLAVAKLALAEIVVALEEVHRRSVIYRDLKLENILVDDEGHVKLTDFGLSKAFYGDELNPLAQSYCGTIEYMAPEIIKRTPKGYDESVDWWSLGVIAFELLTGCSPFTVDGDQNSTQDIAKRILSKKVPYPKTMDDTSRQFINSLLNKDPSSRLGAKGVDEIRKHRFFAGIDWAAVVKRECKAPLKISRSNNIDVENFAPEFTNQAPIFSPADGPVDYQGIFQGYSFVSPSVIFSTDNIIGEESMDEGIRLLSTSSPFFAKYQLDTSAEGFLGRGSFSIVRRCRRLADGCEFAVKIVSQRFQHHASREIRILELLNPHKHIVQLVEALNDPVHYYIVMELLDGGELLQALTRMAKFTEVQAAMIMKQLVSAVSHMHSNNVVHRDLKPENILFESREANANLRLVDFGFARLLPTNKETLVTPYCGTLHYAAPEVFGQDMQDELPQYNQQCDLWSLGVILYTMLSGKVPFRARSQNESAAESANTIIERIKVAEFSFADPLWDNISDIAKRLIIGLLTVDPKKRLSLAQVMTHPWLIDQSEMNSSYELQTPTILPLAASDLCNETINAFKTANRDGFHLMDVGTAPLLVKRRGMKRRLEREPTQKLSDHTRKTSNLNSVPEGVESKGNPRPNTLGLGEESTSGGTSSSTSGGNTSGSTESMEGNESACTGRENPTPSSTVAAFTEYREPSKSPYLKYSRDLP